MNICDGNKDCSGGEDERFTLCKSEGVAQPLMLLCLGSIHTATIGQAKSLVLS